MVMWFRLILCSISFCLFAIVPSYANELSTLQTRAEQATDQEIVAVLSDLEELLVTSPDDYAALFLKARLLEKTKNSTEAEKIYRQLIKLNPQRPEAYNNLARLSVAAGDLAGAQLLLEKAIRANPTYATIYDNLSQIYVAMARDSYGKALRLETDQKHIELAELTELTSEPTVVVDEQYPIAQPPAVAKDTAQADVQINLSAAPAATDSSEQTSVVDETEIITTLEGWAAAWSQQAADVYFVFYAEDYHPPGQSRSSWQQERRSRLKKPSWIRIGLKDIEVKPINNIEAKVELTQVYEASNYQDKTRKELMLRQTPDGWRIVAERSVSRIN